uniref:RING-type E3 ubiquitin transferase n=1 Tax=Anopheles atroparvus TaxID=41427 RepID=A0A182IXJ0_ANOAO
MEANKTTSGGDGQRQPEPPCTVIPPPLDNATAALIVCRFYQLGRCRRGTSCRFIHSTDGEGSAKAALQDGVAGTTRNKSEANSGGAPATSTKALAATRLDPSKWINAPEFVPKARSLEDENEEAPNVQEPDDGGGARGLSYASIVKANNNNNGTSERRNRSSITIAALCPYYEEHGQCALPDCTNKHGQLCDLCRRYSLHPDDAEQRKKHTAACIQQHEVAMEHSFAVQRSFDKTCGICLEVILEKRARERRFGILPNCKHIFCLSCIRTWRNSNNFENKIKRGCPTCRIASDFVCPSYVWIESDEEKKKLIDDYKLACNATDCMHFKKGAAKCPFGNKCFYRHALATGELIDVGAPPQRRERPRRRSSHGFRLEEFFDQFIGPRDIFLDEHVVTFLTDDDDSDFDDFDQYDVEMNYVFRDELPSFESLDSDDELLLSYFDI